MKEHIAIEFSKFGWVWDHLFDTQKLWQESGKTVQCRSVLQQFSGLPLRYLVKGHDTFFKMIFDLQRLAALADPSSISPVFYPIFHKLSQCKFTRHILEKVSCPSTSPRSRLCITKDSREIQPIVREESHHNFLSTRSCFSRSISDGRYLMV